MYVLTKESHPKILRSSGNCADFHETNIIDVLLENEIPLRLGRGITTALVTSRRVLVGSEICEFG